MTPRTPPRLLTIKPVVFDTAANWQPDKETTAADILVAALVGEVRALSTALAEAQQQIDSAWAQLGVDHKYDKGDRGGSSLADTIEALSAENAQLLDRVAEAERAREEALPEGVLPPPRYLGYEDPQGRFHPSQDLRDEVQRLSEENARLRTFIETLARALRGKGDMACDELVDEALAALRGAGGTDGENPPTS